MLIVNLLTYRRSSIFHPLLLTDTKRRLIKRKLCSLQCYTLYACRPPIQVEYILLQQYRLQVVLSLGNRQTIIPFKVHTQMSIFQIWADGKIVPMTLSFSIFCLNIQINVVSICLLADSGFFKNFLYQGGVKSTVSGVFENL